MNEHASMHEDRSKLATRIGTCVMAACDMEVLAPKPGNVGPGESWNFPDLEVADFLASARAIRAVFEMAEELSVGELVLQAVQATRQVVSSNTNLGQILLLAPLAKAAAIDGRIDVANVTAVVQRTNVEDAAAAYEAIALAKPGGMGRRDSQDLADRPTCTLFEAMTIAAAYDDIAAQYANGFADIFELAGELKREMQVSVDWRFAIVDVHVARLVHGDTLVRRKCGEAVEAELKWRAAAVLKHRSDPRRYANEIIVLNGWLRDEGNRRNPGATADLITAALFVGLFSGTIEIPPDLPQRASQYSKSM